MTNKEWLMSLSDSNCSLFCLEWLPLIGRDNMSSVYGVSQWLGYEYNPEYHIIKQFNEIMGLYKLTHQHEDKGE